MKLQRLLVKRFGRFEDFAIDFTDGLNVVVGDNESGKSTLVRALCTALLDKSSPTRPEGANRPEAKETPYLLHLDYGSEDKNYRLTKDSANDLILLEEVETGSRWNSPADVREQLARALGFSEKEFYFATSMVLQDNLAGVESATELIRDKLEKMLSNSKDDLLVSRLLQRILTRLWQIQGNGNEPSGEIPIVEKRVEDWTIELDTIKTKTVELLEARRRRESMVSEIQVTQQLFEDKHDLFRKSKLALEAEQNLRQERETYLELGRRTKDAQETKNLVTTKKDALMAMVRIERSDLKSTETLATQIQLVQGRVDDAASRLEKDEDATRAAQPKSWFRILVGLALLATVVFAFVWNKSHDYLYVGAVGAGMLAAIVVTGVWLAALATYRRALVRQKETESRLSEERESLRKGAETLQALLRRYNVQDVDEMEERYEEYRDLDRDIRTLVARYESLLGNNNLKDLEIELTEMTNRIGQQQETFNKYRAYAISPEKLEQLQRELAELDKKLCQLRDEAGSLEHKLQYLEAGSDMMAPLQERIEAGELELARLREEAEILSIVSRYLEEARRRVLKTSIEILEDESSTMLRALTDNRWQRVRLDRHTLAAEITADGDTWMKSTSRLSKGTVDALHLALRLALVTVISGDVRPPIVLEDPLLYFDDRRRECAMDLLRKLGHDYQVLFLTADRRQSQMSDNLIDLGRPAMSAQNNVPTYSM